MISSRSQLLYSISAVRRMFGLGRTVAVRVRVWWRVVWVHIAGQRPRFVSKRDFHQHFVDQRKAAAEPMQVEQWPEVPKFFTVENPKRSSSYPVTVAAIGPVCQCEDYRNQFHFIGKAVCKHGYAVLGTLGYSSLSEFMEKAA